MGSKGYWICLEKPFDSVWLDNLIYKLKNLGINGEIFFKKVDAFLRSRKGQINQDPYTSRLFSNHFELPQGSVVSPVLFNIFISDFLTNSIKRFIIADHSSVLISGQKSTQSLKNTCLDIEMWCRRWRKAVNRWKTEICL